MGGFYRAERSWTDRPVLIIAGGESLDVKAVRLIGMARTRDLIRVIAVNDAVYPCWFADIAYACDRKWWNFHGSLPGFPGRKLSLEETPFDDVDRLNDAGKEGFDPDPGSLKNGGNGGYQAVHLAAHLGATRIVLVAFDMKGDHWFGRHPAILCGSTPSTKTWIDHFGRLAPILKSMGVSVVNATPGSALACFPMTDLALELISLEDKVMVKSTSVPTGTKTGTKITPPLRPSVGKPGKKKTRDVNPAGKRPGYQTR